MNSLFKEFWEKAVSKSQAGDRSFKNEIDAWRMPFSKITDKLCLIEMTNPETGEKKFAHANELNRCVYYDRGSYNYEELRNICCYMFLKNFRIKIKDDCYYGDSGKEIEKFFTDNFGLLEKFLDSVLVPNGSVWGYGLKDGCEFDVPDALLRKKSQWISSLMDYYVFDDETGEFTDEIEEKPYDDSGHFEYYDVDDYSVPVVIDNWIDAFFLVMVSYFSIRKVKYNEVYIDLFRVDSEGHNDDEVDKCAKLETGLFKDVKFGDRFMTRDGHEAVLYDKTYIKHMGEFEYDLIVFIGEFDPDNWEVQQVCVRENGMCGECEYEWDIVSKC